MQFSHHSFWLIDVNYNFVNEFPLYMFNEWLPINMPNQILDFPSRGIIQAKLWRTCE